VAFPPAARRELPDGTSELHAMARPELHATARRELHA
jgi:hypothetical protein